jgi:hypothetical protein
MAAQRYKSTLLRSRRPSGPSAKQTKASMIGSPSGSPRATRPPIQLDP